MPPLQDTDVLDHPGINTCILNIFDIFDISTTNYNYYYYTQYSVSSTSSTWSACILFTTQRDPWDAEFHGPLIMADLPQHLSSRVPPLHPAPFLSLALYNDDIAGNWLWMPPHTINTSISHIFDVFDMDTIYCNVLHFRRLFINQYMYLTFIPLYNGFSQYISWWEYGGLIKSHMTCIPPTWMTPSPSSSLQRPISLEFSSF